MRMGYLHAYPNGDLQFETKNQYGKINASNKGFNGAKNTIDDIDEEVAKVMGKG